MGELDVEDRGLQLVEPRVEAGGLADLAAAPAILAQFAQALGDAGIVGRHDAGAAGGAEILGRVEAEAADVADRADPLSLPARAMRLGAILDQLDAAAPSD